LRALNPALPPSPVSTGSLTWRRAAKAFGTAGPAPDIEPILKAIHLAPTCFGIQPFSVKVVSKPEHLAALPAMCYGQAQVGQATAVLVFVAKKDAVAEGARFVELKKLPEYAPAYAGMITGFMSGVAAAGKAGSWCERQAYLALGFALAAAAEHRIASCPMEGFSAADVGKLVGVKDDEEVTVILAVGRFPADEAAYMGSAGPQWRHDKDALITNV
jgi:nitroreductase/dihydropteridine reductase